MSIQTDVLVIGSGAAGAVALARAKQRGLNAYGISKSLGASGYSSGAVSSYNLASEAIQLFQKITLPVGYTLMQHAVNQVGVIKTCLMTQASHVFDLNTVRPGEILGVVEFTGLTCFRGAPVANMLKYQGYETLPITVELGQWDTFLAFAKAFEDPDVLDNCMDAIVQAVEASGIRFKHIFLPAIFGFESPMLFLRSLQMRAGVTFSELLGLSHSIPGLRLGKILSREFKTGTATGFKLENKRITQVVLASGEVIEPKSVILATGRYLGGGFAEKETIFGLPLVNMALALDKQQRPLGKFGEVFANNLYAAGSVNGGLGEAIATGYLAGELC
jgi:anaerobic glycerol-3-phosphate dehydrogenase